MYHVANGGVQFENKEKKIQKLHM